MAGLIGFSDYSVPATDPNQQVVPAQVTAQDMAQLGNAVNAGPEGILAMNLGKQRENDLVQNNQIMQDWGLLSPNDFVSKYGPAIADQMGKVSMGQAELTRLQDNSRTNTTATGDFANNVVQGLVGGLGDVASLGAGLIHRDLGRAVGGLTQDFREGMQSLQSETEQRDRFLDGMKSQLDELDNTASYDAAKAEGSSTMEASLAYLGRGIVNGAGRIFEDPMSIQRGLGEGIGSLLAGGPVSKGVTTTLGAIGRMASKKIMADVVEGAVERSAAGAIARSWGDKATLPIAVGLQEGGNAYNSAVQQVMSMSHEQLMAGSQEYRTLVSGGTDPEEAKQQIASQAGIAAAAIAGPTGALAGKLTAGFEAAPFAAQTVRGMVQNVGKETLEEGLQGFTGGVAGNVGQSIADNSVTPLQGVGDQIGEGAVLGSLTAGAIQAPGAASRAAVQGLKAGVDKLVGAGQDVVDNVNETQGVNRIQRDRIKREMAADAADLETDVTDSVTNANQKDIPDNVDTTEAPLKPSVDASKEEVAKEILDSALVTPVSKDSTDPFMEDMHPALREVIMGRDNAPKNKLEMADHLSSMVSAKDVPEEGRAIAALTLKRLMSGLQDTLEVDLPAAASSKDMIKRERMKRVMKNLNDFASSPAMIEALKVADNAQGTSEDINIEIAKSNPGAINEKMARDTLYSDGTKKVLTPTERRSLTLALKLKDIAKNLLASSEQVPAQEGEPARESITNEADAVNRQITETGGELQNQYSLNQYTAGINGEMAVGRTIAATRKLERLLNFAQHMSNKVDAWNESMQTGQAAEYTRFGMNGRALDTNGKVTVHKDDPKSLAMGRQIHAEAKALHDLFHEMRKTYPDLKIKGTVSLAPLDAGFGTKGKTPSKPKGPEQSRITPEQIKGATLEQLMDRMGRIQDRAKKGEYQEGDAATLDVLNDEVIRRLEEDKKDKKAAKKAVAETALTDEIHQNAYDKMVKFADSNKRVPLSEFTPEEKLSLASKWGVDVKSKYGYLPDGLYNRVIKTTNATTAPVVEPVITNKVEARFPFLIKTKNAAGRVVSRFSEAFRLPEEPTSRMQEMQDVYKTMMGHINGDASLEEVFGTLGFEDNQKIRKNLADMMWMAKDMANAVQKQFAAAYKSNEYLQKLVDEERDATQMQRYRLTALLQDKDGKLGLNPDLMVAAGMAAVHWRLNSGYMAQNMSLEDIAKMLGMTEDEAQQYQEVVNSGMTMNIAVKSLSEMIRKFWGVEGNPDVGDGIVQGIVDNVAREMIRAMMGQVSNEDLKDGNVSKVTLPGMDLLTMKRVGDTNVYIVSFKPNKGSFFGRIESRLKGEDFFLADAMIIGKWDKGIYVGAPAEVSQRTQIRRPQVPLTKEQNVARKALESIPHYLNTALVYIIEKAGEEAVRVFRGGTKMLIEQDQMDTELSDILEDNTVLVEKPLNNKHKLSVDGKNLTLFTSYNDAMRLKRMMAASTVEGHPVWGKPVFFGWGVNSLGRFQMFGRSNPESDKLMRDMIPPTINTLDMTDPAGTHAQGFWKAIAQGLGVKTHRVFNTVSMPEMIKQTTQKGGKFTHIVQNAKELITEGENVSERDAQNLLLDLQAAMNDTATMQALTAILEVAKYELAKEAGTEALKSFNTIAYMEADGITNGPFMALLRYGVGAFSAGWIEMVQRGGLFFGSSPVTMNEYQSRFDNAKDPLRDIYMKVAARASEAVNAQFLNASPEVLEHYKAIQQVMGALSVNLTPNKDGGIDITRDGAKNPVTISVYASSLNGMNRKVRFELEKLIYAHISETMEYETPIGSFLDDKGGKTFRADLEKITGQALAISEDENLSVVLGPKSNDRLQLPLLKDDKQKFVFSKTQSAILEENLRHFYTNHLYGAIDDLMLTHVKTSTDAMLKTSQIQSIVMSEMFKKAVLERMVEKELNPALYPEYKRNDGLSQNELRKIWKELMPFAPVIETGTQNFMIGGGNVVTDFGSMSVKSDDGKSKTVKMPETYGSDLIRNGMETITGYHGPEHAGVGVVPVITIGTGDALAMQKLFAKVAKEKGLPVLSVYDGLHINVERLQEIAQKMNESVAEALQENPLEAMANNFDLFMQNGIEKIIKDLSLAAKLDLTKTIMNAPWMKRPMSDADLITAFEKANDRLAKVAEATAIRTETIMSIPFSLDQMSGAEKPFQNEGTAFGRAAFADITIDSTPAEIEAAMNKVRMEVIRIRPLRRAAEARVDAKKEARLINAIQEEARQIKSLKDTSGAIVMPAWQLIRTIKGKVPYDHWKAMELALASFRSDEVKVVIGTREEVDAYQMDHHGVESTKEQKYEGKYDVKNDTVYIVNLNTETIAHELIHAVTAHKLAAYYVDPSKVQKFEAEAIERIEALLVEFMDDGMRLNPSQERRDQMAYNQMRDRLQAILATGDKMVAVSEFLSYMMTDESLVRLAKQTKVRSKLALLGEKVFQALKDLIWGKAVAVQKEVTDNFYDNLRFNLQIISSNKNMDDTNASQLSNVTLYQSNTFGSDGDLDLLQEKLKYASQKLYAHSRLAKGLTKADKVEYLTRVQKSQNRYDADLNQARAVADSLVAAGFDMNMQQKTAFHDLVAVMFSDMLVNRNSMSRMQDVYDHFIQNVSVNDFRQYPGLEDGSITAQNDKAQAKQKLDALTGKLGVSITANNQSDLLAVFVGLAMVHPDMKAVLEGMQMPKIKVDFPAETSRVDQFLTKWGTEAMERLDRWASGEGSKKNVSDVMDSLVGSMLRNKLDQETFVETQAKNVMNKTDKWLSDFANQQMLKLSQASSDLAKKANNTLVKKAAQAVTMVSALMTKEANTGAINDIISMVNKDDSFLPLREVLVEVIGQTDENKKVYKLINITRKMVDQIRQQFRDELPQLIKNKFKKAITSEDWAAFTTTFGRSGVAVLMNAEGKDQALRYIEDGRAGQGRMVALTNQIEAMDPKFSKIIMKKADQLANFMMTGVAGPALQRNPEAIALLLGQPGFKHSSRANIDLKALETLIEQYVALKALSMVDQISRNRVRTVLATQPEAVSSLLDTLTGIHNDELRKASSDRGRLNRYMGYIRPQNQEGSEVIVAPLKDAPDLILRGYTKIGDYKGSGNDLNRGSMAYYHTPVSGLVHFNQGIIQNTRDSFSGVDPETGFSLGQVAGRVTGRSVSVIAQQRQEDDGGAEALMPIWDENGSVVAYERAMDPTKLEKIKTNTNLAELLGAWRGRQMEEAMAREVNHQSIKAVHSMWVDGQAKRRTGEFVDLQALKREDDPVMFEAWRLIPKHVKEEIFDVYGAREFWVRKDMRNTVVGTHSAMVGDFWTGQTRMSPENQERFRNAALGAFGAFGKEAKAYTSLMTAQQMWQGVVSDARQMIVVKSIIVPAANLLSNMKHMSNLGIGFRQILVGVARKTAETNDYMKRRRLEIELDSDLLAARGRKDEPAVIRISNRIQAIRDSYKKMSIWPLIEAGEFSSISAGGFDKELVALSEGRWGSIIETLQDRLPEGLKTPYRYALLTKDTPIYRAMSLATQYGDFISKSILYDHLTQTNGKTQTEALEQITEEFVNYNFYAGRTRALLESMGLTWFWTYKLRSIKVAGRTLRDHPLKSIMAMSINPNIPMIGSIGTPLTDNMVSVLADGSWTYTLGPGMVTSAGTLHPWYNLIN